MKKQKKGRKLSREKDQRKALLKSLLTALILKEKIKTTKAKAKEFSGSIEKFITKAKQVNEVKHRGEREAFIKQGNLASIRSLNSFLSERIVKKLITNIAPRYKERNGGYIRVINLSPRKSDGAKMAIIELVK